MKRPLHVTVVMLLLGLATSSIAQDTEPLITPSFSSAGFPVYENNILFGLSNPNDGSETQIFRALSADGSYVLIATVPYDEIAYQDSDLKPRTTFYYRLRAARDEQVSGFSEPRAYTSGSKLYAPEINGIGKTFSIDLTFTDKSYDDVSYGILRSEEGSSAATQIKSINAPDSGQVFHFTDSGLNPNTTYHYRVEAYTKGPNNPYYPNLASTTVTTGDEVITPEFTEPEQAPCGTAVAFGVVNYNADAMVEVYRSVSADDGFELHYTLNPGESSYVDAQLPPRTTFYYKLRAMSPDGSASEFSESLSLTSGSDFFNPLLDGTRGEEPNTIQLTFQDRSYGDSAYHIYKTYKDWSTEEYVTELLQELILPDSGASATIVDTLNSTFGEFRYSVNAVLACEGNPVYYAVAGDTLYIFSQEPSAPYIDASVPTFEHCADVITFYFQNDNANSETEIWRADSYGGEYELISLGGESGVFSDTTVVPGEDYFYKLRAASEGEVSEFSEALEFTAEPRFNQPNLYLTYIDEGAEVLIQLQDESDLERNYELYISEEGAGFPIYYDPIYAEGPGTITSIKDHPIPGRTYVYSIDMVLDCGSKGVLIRDVVSQTFAIPDGPAVYEFVLVDPYTDEDVRKIWPLDVGFDAQPRYNIRVDANDLTHSVEFHLNGVRYWGENQEPYALFGDRFGNFNPGRLKPGQYTLTATAYGANLHKGKKGNTIGVNFEVYDNGTVSLLTDGPLSNVRMNVFPNPVLNHAEIEVSGMPNQNVSLQLIDESGNPVDQMNEVLDHDGLLLKQWDASALRKGTYFIYIKMKDETVTRRIIVD